MNKSVMERTGATLALGLALVLAMIGPTWAGRDAIRSAKSWSYQLTGDMSSTRQSSADLAVIDPDYSGDASKFKTKPDGGMRTVLAYISIGEAEVSRKYMNGAKQSWNTGRTRGWSGNYATKFWDSEWKSIVKSRVREALANGYDGVYLDRIDTYEIVKAPGGSRAEMIQFVKEIANEVRAKNSDAAVIVQNGEELLNDKSYVAAIDGVAKEDLYHGIQHRGERNSVVDVNASKSFLNMATAQGKTIFVVEYLSGSTAGKVADEARHDGYIPYTRAPRSLDRVAN